MIKMICSKCNCEADHFSSRLLKQKEVEELSVQYNSVFENDLISEIYVCPNCGDIKEFIHILYK